MSKIDLEKLEDSQFDVLKEIGNIGAGNFAYIKFYNA